MERSSRKSWLWEAKLFFAIVLLLLLPSIRAKAGTAPFALHMLDVGQGLSVLVEADGHYMLIDGGGRSSSSFVVSYLQQQGVERLDYIVVSHYDEDHISGIVGALHVFECGTILAPDYQADTNIYASYLAAAEESGAEVIYPQQGETYALGEAVVTVVGPASYENALENDRCVAVRISYGITGYLICGDAQAQEEEDIISSGQELESDVYVVNHHGSADSSGFYFLNAVKPVYALLSCSADNSYGHPAEETMQRLDNEGVSLYRTDRQGTVTAYSDGTGLWFDQEPCDDFSAQEADDQSISEPNRPEAFAQETGDQSISEPNGPEAFTQGADDRSIFDQNEPESPAQGEQENFNQNMQDGSGAAGTTYVCNLNTKKFHYAYCDSVNKMKESNKKFTDESRDSLIAQGYVPCKNCNP